MSPRLVPIRISRAMVPVDGSDHSKKAVELAIELTKLSGAQLYFIHVLEEANAPKWFKECAEVEQLGTADYFDIVDK